MAVLDIVVKVSGDGSVEIDKVKKSAQSTEKATDKLKDTNKQLGDSYKDLKSDIKKFAGTVAGVYALAKGFEALYAVTRKVAVDGFGFNTQIEEAKAGLSALSLAIQDKTIPLTERMTVANNEATASLKALQAVNAQTPHTLDQTNQIYKAMYVSMKNVGASSQEIVDLTQKLSVASGAAGIEFNSLLAGVDGLATGTVLANSDLGRFLGSLGLTNEALKNSDNVVKLLNESLKDFKQLDTINTSTSNLKNSWDELAGVLTKDLFNGAKTGLNSLSDTIKGLSDKDIENIKNALNGMAIVALETAHTMVQGFITAKNAVEVAGTAIADIILWLTEWDGDYDAMSKSLWENTNKNLEASEKLSKSIEEAKEKTKEAINTSNKRVKSVLDESKAYDLLNSKVDRNAEAIGQVTDAELQKIYADELLALGLDAQGNELEETNRHLKESYGLYSLASGSADGYANSIDNITNALKGNQAVTKGGYSTITRLETPQDYATYGFDLPSDYYTNPDYQHNFNSGGYTGDMGVDQISGFTHGQEYVVNAQTTKDLGLNGQGGTFQSIEKKLDMLQELPKMLTAFKKMLTLQKESYALAQAGV